MYKLILKYQPTALNTLQHGSTLWHHAATFCLVELLYVLKHHGKHLVNTLDSYGDAPIHQLARLSSNDIKHGRLVAETLVEAGADVNLLNKDGHHAFQILAPENLPAHMFPFVIKATEKLSRDAQEEQLISRFPWRQAIRIKSSAQCKCPQHRIIGY